MNFNRSMRIFLISTERVEKLVTESKVQFGYAGWNETTYRLSPTGEMLVT